MAQPSEDTRTFPSTCWSQIQSGPDARERAVVALAERYWRPAHAYLRSAGRSRDEARDLVQDFFLWVIESGFLAKADPARGRFRAFLKTALSNFAIDADRRAATHKRGGAARTTALGAFVQEGDEEPWEIADPASLAPDEALDAAWRAEVVRVALDKTRARLEDAGHALVFAVFRDYFLDPAGDVDYRALADRHGITTVDVSNFLMRAKRTYKAELRAEVIETVGSTADLEGELAWLIGRGA